MKTFIELLFEMTADQAADIIGYKDGDDLKKKYKEAARNAHPDLGGSEEKMKEVNNAYEVLKKTKPKSSKVDWGDIHKKYIDMCKFINEELEKTFNFSIFEKYLEETVSGKWKTESIKYYGENYYKGNDYGSPSFAGMKIRFKSTKNYIDLDFTVYLTSLRNSSGLSSSLGSIPLKVNSTGFIQNRKFKLYQKEWDKLTISSKTINQPETFLPKVKLKKQLTKEKRTKATKKDFISLFTSMGAKLAGDTYMISVKNSKDTFLGIRRGTMMRKGYYTFDIYKKGGYSYTPQNSISGILFEDPELLDFISSLEDKTEKQTVKELNAYIKKVTPK